METTQHRSDKVQTRNGNIHINIDPQVIEEYQGMVSCRLGIWCSIIFQLYRGGQFYWQNETGVP